MRRSASFPAYRQLLSRTLLVLVAFGVLGMHSVGHLVPGSAHCPQAGLGGSPRAVAAVATHVVSVTCQCADSCADPSGECLAVLTGLGLLLLIAVLLFAVRRSGGFDSSGWRAMAVALRGPPRAGTIGLVIADLSVLRR